MQSELLLQNCNELFSGSNMRLLGSQPQQIATPPSASIYNNSQQPSLYNSSTSNGTTIGGKPSSVSL